jgi:hypothetical protein
MLINGGAYISSASISGKKKNILFLWIEFLNENRFKKSPTNVYNP